MAHVHMVTTGGGTWDIGLGWGMRRAYSKTLKSDCLVIDAPTGTYWIPILEVASMTWVP